MDILQNIKQIVADNSPEEALKKLQPLVDAPKMEGNHDSRGEAPLAAVLAEKGKLLWKTGDRAGAISAYEESAQEDPQGPGALLLEHTRGIMDFFDPNQLNP